MINSMNRHTPIRMMGLSSGMDTDMIIQQTLRLHQFRIDNRARDRTILEWRQETHNSIRDEITALQRNFMTVASSAMHPLLSRGTFNSTSANITGANAGAVSIRTNTNTPLGSMRIDRVESLARGASIASRNSVTGVGGSGISQTAGLSSLRFEGGDRINFSGELTDVDGNTVTVSQADWESAMASLNDPNNPNNWSASVATLNLTEAQGIADGAGQPQVIRDGNVITLRFEGGHEVSIPAEDVEGQDPPGASAYVDIDVDGETVRFTLARDERGNVTVSNDLEGEGAVNINVNNRQFTQTATVNIGGANFDVERNINFAGTSGNAARLSGETSAPVFSTEFTINNGDRSQTFTVNSNESLTALMDRVNRSNLGVTMSYNGLTDRFTISSNAVNSAADSISITDGSGGNMLSLFNLTGADAEVTAGSNAVAYINGERVERTSNTFQFRGLDITLNSTTAAGSEPIDINFQRNTDDAMTAIRSFIDAYNTLVSRLETLTSERQSRSQRSYRPLTDEEMQHMTERQVDEWQRVARIGIMRNDNALERLATNVRREFFNNIEGMGISAAQIGLTTGPRDGGTGGQIIIDEDRLRAALERDPEMVADIFSRVQTNPETGQNEGVGLIHRLNDRFNDFTRSQRDSLSSLENSLRRTNEQIERMQARMFAEEDRLFRQFAAMEGAMTNMQNQGAWFSSMLGSM